MFTKKQIEEASEIAYQFGFRPINTLWNIPQTRKVRPSRWERNYNTSLYDKRRLPDSYENSTTVRGLISILKHAYERDIHNSETPILLFHSTVDKLSTGHLFPKTQRVLPFQFSLTVLNIHDGFAEALALTCATRILNNTKNTVKKIRINSIGDDISFERFRKAVHKSLKHNESKIPQHHLKIMGSNIFECYKNIMHDKECEHIHQVFPNSMAHLTLAGQDHFQNVLDYIEAQGLPFEIAPSLIGDKQVHSHTIIDIKGDEGSGIHAQGGRFNNLSRSILHTSLPLVNITISCGEEKQKKQFLVPVRRKKKPQMYFIHTEQESRKKALQILDFLCEKQVCVEHRLHLKKVSEQLDYGEGRKFSYILIIGHQEVLNGLATLKIKERGVVEKIAFNKIPQRLKRIR